MIYTLSLLNSFSQFHPAKLVSGSHTENAMFWKISMSVCLTMFFVYKLHSFGPRFACKKACIGAPGMDLYMYCIYITMLILEIYW